jgi:hypothetical protein
MSGIDIKPPLITKSSTDINQNFLLSLLNIVDSSCFMMAATRLHDPGLRV